MTCNMHLLLSSVKKKPHAIACQCSRCFSRQDKLYRVEFDDRCHCLVSFLTSNGPPPPPVSALTEFPVFENPSVSANFCESRQVS